ncbi:MAG: 2-oxoglutarate oxidoreductase subunit KorA [Chloroflexi bacterium]|nr:2-oxoglutarate oxidoreductase subunit KorA [Chloroflexota bacterium]
MTATSGPGFSLMQEGIGYAAMTETPIVIVNIQRAGPATGQATRVGGGDIMQARWGSQGDYQVIAISPWSVQEMYDQTINAFNLAERYRVPVILLGEQAVGHLWERMDVREKIAIFDRRKEKGVAPFGAGDDGVPPMPAFGEGEKLLVTGSTHDDYGWRKVADPLVQARLTTRLHNKIVNNREEIVEYQDYYAEEADVIVIAYGFTARSSLFAVEAIRREGKRVGMIRLKTVWPFADSLIRDVGSQVKKIFVPEMNRGQIVGEVMKYTCCDIIPYNQTDGEIIHPNTIMEELRRLL